MAAPAVAAAAPVHFIAPTAFSVYRQVAGAIESESVDLALVDRLRAALLTNDKTFGTTVTQVLKIPEKYACASVHGATLTIANVYNCLLAGASPIGPAGQALPSCFELQGTEWVTLLLNRELCCMYCTGTAGARIQVIPNS